MQIQDISISYINYNPDDIIKNRIIAIIKRLDKYKLHIIWIKVAVHKQKFTYTIKLELHSNQFDVEAKSNGFRIYSVIKKAVADASKQIRRTKSKKNAH